MNIYTGTFGSSLFDIQQQTRLISQQLRIIRPDAINEKIRLLFHISALQNSLISRRVIFISRDSFVVYTNTPSKKIDKKIQKLVQKCLSHLSSEQLSSILNLVTSKGYGALIQTLIKVVGAPLPAPRGIMGRLSSYLHHNQRHFSIDAIGAAVVEAAKHGYEDIVIDLVNTVQNIPPSFLAHAVHSAASKGYERIISFLLSEGRSLSTGDTYQAIIHASAGGFVNVLRILLSSPLELDMTRPMQMAAERGYLEAIEFLLSVNTNISIDLIADLFVRAIANDHLPIAQMLIIRDPQLIHHINPRDRNDAIFEAIQHRRIESLQILLQLGPIRSRVRDQALLNTSWPERGWILHAFSLAQVFDDESVGTTEINTDYRIVVSHDEIKSHPEKYLELIYKKGLPERISFHESPQSLDLGGLSKQFISELCSAFIAKNTFYLNSEGMPFTEEKNLSIFTFMGRFISLLEQKNQFRTDKFLTGEIFNPNFFELVRLLHDTDCSPALPILAQHLKTIAPHYSTFFDVIIDPSVENELACIQLSEELDLAIYPNVHIAAEQICLYFIKPAFCFFVGLSDALRNKLASSGADAFAIYIQGEKISREALISSLHVDPSELIHVERQLGWIITKIQNADELWMQHFLRAITGKNSLHPDMKINIAPASLSCEAFIFQICYNKLYIPCRDGISESLFLASLDSAIGVDDFNII